MRGHFDLDFVAGVVEFFAAFEENVVQFVALGQGIAKERSGYTMEAFVEWIEENEAVVGENAREKIGKRAAVSGFR